MATLTYAEQNWYRDNLTNLAQSASNAVSNRVGQIINQQQNNGGVDVADVRNKTIDLVDASVNVFGENAKALSNEFFDYCLELQGSNKKASYIENDFDIDWIEDRIHYLATHLVDEEFEQYIEQTGKYSDYLVRRAAFWSLLENAKKNKVRFARIPSGTKTCAFCMMLASRGFVYHSEESAGGGFFTYHKNCDCEVIPSEDGNIDVEGYDLDLYQGLYYEARNNASKGFDYSKGGKAYTNRTLSELDKLLKEFNKNIGK